MESNLYPSGASTGEAVGLAESLWSEILGPDADTSTGFLENGGDSFRAVLLATRLYELTGREIEYLDVLEADEAGAIARLLTTDTPGS
ncbi:phosphopantetheine-binding protein [Streptomyces pratens]|uniref:Phosphopantetheine-binding protein n=1 Tax=Streptomyces pratens TaxID=887456 RepID=A0ABW1M9F3_9ACTN